MINKNLGWFLLFIVFISEACSILISLVLLFLRPGMESGLMERVHLQRGESSTFHLHASFELVVAVVVGVGVVTGLFTNISRLCMISV